MMSSSTFVNFRRERIQIAKRPERTAEERRITSTYQQFQPTVNRVRDKYFTQQTNEFSTQNELQFWRDKARIARKQAFYSGEDEYTAKDTNFQAIDQYYQLQEMKTAAAQKSIRNCLFDSKWKLHALLQKIATIDDLYEKVLVKRMEATEMQQKRLLKALHIWNLLK